MFRAPRRAVVELHAEDRVLADDPDRDVGAERNRSRHELFLEHRDRRAVVVDPARVEGVALRLPAAASTTDRERDRDRAGGAEEAARAHCDFAPGIDATAFSIACFTRADP